jgi:hypothetical protein
MKIPVALISYTLTIAGLNLAYAHTPPQAMQDEMKQQQMNGGGAEDDCSGPILKLSDECIRKMKEGDSEP